MEIADATGSEAASEGLLASMITRTKVTVLTVESRLDIFRMNSGLQHPFYLPVRAIEAIMVHCHLAGPTIDYDQVAYLQEFEKAVTQFQQEGAWPSRSVEPFSDLAQPPAQLMDYHRVEHRDLDVYLTLMTHYEVQEYNRFRTRGSQRHPNCLMMRLNA